MNLFEFQGKRLFSQKGIPIPEGQILTSTDELDKVTLPAVLKAQVHSGGRGKAGGVKVCKSREEAREALEHILGMTIGGLPVAAVLAEGLAEIQKEYYLSITLPAGSKKAMVMFSPAGGVEIEKVAEEDPEQIYTFYVDPFIGITGYQIRHMAKKLGYGDARDLGKILTSLYDVFVSNDATLVEINPLVVTPDGLLALDSKVVLDDKAVIRQKELFDSIYEENGSLPGVEKEETKDDTITYVPLDSGSVGLISDGAGTGMLTLDLIRDAGGEAACFCEMGGLTSPEVMYSAMEKVLKDPKVKSLLVVLIGGFNRMDEMAEGIVRYRDEKGLEVPIAVRMCGTLEEEGEKIMKSAGLPICRDLLEAVRTSVQMAGRE
jgi:succinyl-CoA synthetase beta subunit